MTSFHMLFCPYLLGWLISWAGLAHSLRPTTGSEDVGETNPTPPTVDASAQQRPDWTELHHDEDLVAAKSPAAPKLNTDAVESLVEQNISLVSVFKDIDVDQSTQCQAESLPWGHHCTIGCRCNSLCTCTRRQPHGHDNTLGLGVCTLDTPKVAMWGGIVAFACWLVIRSCMSRCSGLRALQSLIGSEKLSAVLECISGAEDTRTKRRELEGKLRKATPMTPHQSHMLLNQFFCFESELIKSRRDSRREIRKTRLAAGRDYYCTEMERQPHETEEKRSQ